ncbi:MAG: hypothetical protein H0W64_09080 [Gammaproteobacteria bacterium]|nr:hypothetical protein [Gammaproteobacteria bacterium]
MFKFIDQWIEKKLKKKLHKQRPEFIQQTLDGFIKKHNPDPTIIKNLSEKLEIEADRIYPIVDRSIIKERLKRSKYTFWITAVVSTIIVGIIIAFTGGALLPLVVPLLTSFIAWAIALGTIPLSYNQRILGAMDSTVDSFEKSLLCTLECQELKDNKAELESVHDMLLLLTIQMKALTEKVNALTPSSTMVAFDKEEEKNNENPMGRAFYQSEQILSTLTKEVLEKPKLKHHHHAFRKLHFWKKKDSFPEREGLSEEIRYNPR